MNCFRGSDVVKYKRCIYGFEVLNLNKSRSNYLDFVANRFLTKLFNTNDMKIIELCREQFNFVFPSRQIANRRDTFIRPIMLTAHAPTCWLSLILYNSNQRQCLWCYPHDHGHCRSCRIHCMLSISICYLLLVFLFLWSPYVIGQTIIFVPCTLFLSSIYLLFFPRLISAAATGWMSTILWHMVWP